MGDEVDKMDEELDEVTAQLRQSELDEELDEITRTSCFPCIRRPPSRDNIRAPTSRVPEKHQVLVPKTAPSLSAKLFKQPPPHVSSVLFAVLIGLFVGSGVTFVMFHFRGDRQPRDC